MIAAAEHAQDVFDCDLLVVGTGAGGMCAALAAVRRGFEVMVVEATDAVGGTTSYSGAGIWLPNNAVTVEAGVEDSMNNVRAYLDSVVGDPETAELRETYVRTAPAVVDELLASGHFEFEWRPFPDYFPEAPGFQPRGRGIFPLPVDKQSLDDVEVALRPPLPVTRGGHDTGDFHAGGQALIARFLLALNAYDVPIATNAALHELIQARGRVVGAVVDTDGERTAIRARRGVLIAAGGFEQNVIRRRDHGHPVEAGWTMGAPGGTGTALHAAERVGAATQGLDQCWWTPAFLTSDGPAFRVRDRGHPGSIMVDNDGRRFVNESLPYDRVGRVMEERTRAGELELPCWFVIDQQFLDRYGVNGVPAGDPLPEGWLSEGHVARADTLLDLAAQIGVDGAGLQTTVARVNEFARRGVDDDFERGSNAFDQFFGDSEVLPNNVLAPLEKPPFHALSVVLSDLGTKGGLVCDSDARVFNTDGQPIGGLYATGNSMAPWSGQTYPAPGVPIGTSLLFAYRAVLHMDGADDGEDPD